VFCDLDYWQTDAVCIRGDTLAVYLNPMTEGLFVTLSASTALEEQMMLQSTLSVFLHGYGDNIRVAVREVI